MKDLFHLSREHHGQGRVAIAWNQDGNFLATCGVNRDLHIWGRDGKQVASVTLGPGRCDGLEWDAEGDRVAVRQAGSGIVTIWSLASHQTTPFDTGFACGTSKSAEQISFLKWSRVGPELAVGSSKGNLVLYNSSNRRKIPLLGIHSKSIVCGAWSLSNKLVVGSADKSFSLLDASGNRVMERSVSAAPQSCSFSIGKGGEESTLAISLSGKSSSIQLFDLDDAEKAPLSIAFKKAYGAAVVNQSYGSSYMIVGFGKGTVCVASTHSSELGDELFSAKLFRTKLADLSFSPALQRAAVCGDYSIKIIEKSAEGWAEVAADERSFDESVDGAVESVQWTKDGNILACSCAGGSVYAFVGAMPSVHAAHHTRVAFLSSLREITIVNTHTPAGGATPSREVVVKLADEPSMVAISPTHVAAAAHSTAYFYAIADRDRDAVLAGKREYPGLIDGLSLSAEHVACVCSGRLHLGSIPGANGSGAAGEEDRDTKMGSPVSAARHGRARGDSELEAEQGRSAVLPLASEGSHGSVVTAHLTATGAFVVYATSSGLIAMFSLADWAPLTKAYYHHECGVRVIAPGPTGTRIAFLDDLGRGYVLSPSDGVAVPMNGLSTHCISLMWDLNDWNVHGNYVVVANTGDALDAFTYAPMTWNGPVVTHVGPIALDSLQMEGLSTPLDGGFKPVLCNNGRVVCQIQGGARLRTKRLLTHSTIDAHHGEHADEALDEDLESAFSQNLGLLRLSEARAVAKRVHRRNPTASKTREMWLALSNKAMEQLDIALATAVQRLLGDAGMVMSLERIANIDDLALLMGHVAMLFGQHEHAQGLFMRSYHPLAALEVRCDLVQWEQALGLARQLAPERVPSICIRHAQQLELLTEYAEAQRTYEDAQRSAAELDDETLTSAERVQCDGGIARCRIRMGEYREGKKLALQVGSAQLCRECAVLLEEENQSADAAILFEKGGAFEQAATIWIRKCKNYQKAALLMAKISRPSLHQDFAKLMEASGKQREALASFERAADWDNVARMLIDVMTQPERAKEMARTSRSPAAADRVARNCQSTGSYDDAIEFLLIARRNSDAYELAAAHNSMKVFAEHLGERATQAECLQMAEYHEAKMEWESAGEIYARPQCGNYRKALEHFLRCGDRALDSAIKVVGSARQDSLTHMLIDFLNGETDNHVKDAKYIYQLYMALGHYSRAAETATSIAQQEQVMGEYVKAHEILFDTCRALLSGSQQIPSDLRDALSLLHSYTLVKKHKKRGNGKRTAYLLLRVAASVSKFPMHDANLLTATVVTCKKMKMHGAAHEWAATLMTHPEMRGKVDPAYGKKLEKVVRKKPKAEDRELPPPHSPCPFCKGSVSEMDLKCTACLNPIPMCIVTGKHMVLDDWSTCPACRFPALYTDFRTYLTTPGGPDDDGQCPMCNAHVAVETLVRFDEDDEMLQRALRVARGLDPAGEKEEEADS